METFAFGTIAVHGLVVTKTSHRVTPFFVFDALEFFVLRTAEFAFMTPETDVGKKSFSIFEHSFICLLDMQFAFEEADDSLVEIMHFEPSEV